MKKQARAIATVLTTPAHLKKILPRLLLIWLGLALLQWYWYRRLDPFYYFLAALMAFAGGMAQELRESREGPGAAAASEPS